MLVENRIRRGACPLFQQAIGLLAVAILVALVCTVPAAGQGNPILEERLEQKIVEELSKHNTEETAWYNEKSVDKQKWTEGKIIGRPIRLASWTEQSKTWVWLEEPEQTLSIDLKRLAINQGRVEFSLTATAKARFKAWGRIPKFAQASVGGTVRVAIEIDGSAAVGAGQLQDAKIARFSGTLDDLKFNNKAARPVDDLIEKTLNDYVENKNEKLRRSMEKAIDRVRF